MYLSEMQPPLIYKQHPQLITLPLQNQKSQIKFTALIIPQFLLGSPPLDITNPPRSIHSNTSRYESPNTYILMEPL